jgi:hypothetical protein
MEDRQIDGEAGPRGRELYRQYFIGDRARFSDESTRNKREFRAEMSFADPESEDRVLFCPWHGKIQTPQFRIHFEWPVPVGQRRLKVLYIGPKLTIR